MDVIHENELLDDEPECPGCGAPQADWTENKGKGFIARSGEVYCCQNCSAGKVCSCNPSNWQTGT